MRGGLLIKHSTETYKNEIYELVGNEFILLDEYNSNNKPMDMRHKKCGNIVTIRRHDFLRGTRCAYCSGNRLNTNIVKEKINKETKGKFELVGEYINAREKIDIKHKKCGNITKVTYGKFIKSKNCVICSNRFKKSKKYLQNFINENISKDYTVKGDYINNKTPIEIEHDICKSTLYIRPDHIVSYKKGSLCPKCYTKHKKKKKETINKELKEVNSRYRVVGDYVNAETKITFLDLECGNKFLALTNDILRNEARCPYCRINSIGEDLIKNYLDKKNINYTQEYKLCKNPKTNKFLRVDFYLCINGKKYVIEFDGIQHFEPVDFFGGVKQFEKQKSNDKIKDIYCKDNSISMIRIAYYEKENIQNILNNKFER